MLVSNHLGWMEAAYIMAVYAPSFVAKSSIRKMPIIGWVGDQIGNIWIDRLNKGGGVTRQICDKLETDNTRVAIFPEGTCPARVQ